MSEYKLFYGKEKEMEQAELNLNIYKKNGYAGNRWNVFKRTTYFLMHYEEDRINVKLYHDIRNKIFRSVFNQDDFYTPTRYFDELVQKIKSFPEKIKKAKDNMVFRYGTVERYKDYKQEVAKKERLKERKPKKELEFSLDDLSKKNNKQRKEVKKQSTPKRNRGMSR